MLDYLSWIDRVFIAPFYSVPGGALTTRGPGEHGAGPGDRSQKPVETSSAVSIHKAIITSRKVNILYLSFGIHNADLFEPSQL